MIIDNWFMERFVLRPLSSLFPFCTCCLRHLGHSCQKLPRAPISSPCSLITFHATPPYTSHRPSGCRGAPTCQGPCSSLMLKPTQADGMAPSRSDSLPGSELAASSCGIFQAESLSALTHYWLIESI